jgi:site-specific recombinase XerD
MATIKAILRPGKPDNNGEKQVQLRVLIGGDEKRYGVTGVKVEPRYWNARTGEIKSGHGNAIYLNNVIDKKKLEIRSIFSEFLQEEKDLTIDSFNEVYLKGKKVRKTSFDKFYEEELARRKNKLHLNNDTLKTYKTMYGHLKDFHEKEIMFSAITPNFLAEFEAFLQHEGLVQTSVAKNIEVLRVFVRQAFSDGLMKVYPYNKFRITDGESQTTYLDENNIAKLLKFEPKNTGESKAFDRIRIQLYTGLRFSNITTLKCGHIAEDLSHIATFTEKGNRKLGPRALFIPLLPEAKEILKRYLFGQDGNRREGDELVFPKISNRNYNLHLETIQKATKMDQKLRSHVARHTFGTVAHEKGVDLKVIQEVMGHDDPKSTRRYVQNTRKKILEEMGKFNLKNS